MCGCIYLLFVLCLLLLNSCIFTSSTSFWLSWSTGKSILWWNNDVVWVNEVSRWSWFSRFWSWSFSSSTGSFHWWSHAMMAQWLTETQTTIIQPQDVPNHEKIRYCGSDTTISEWEIDFVVMMCGLNDTLHLISDHEMEKSEFDIWCWFREFSPFLAGNFSIPIDTFDHDLLHSDHQNHFFSIEWHNHNLKISWIRLKLGFKCQKVESPDMKSNGAILLQTEEENHITVSWSVIHWFVSFCMD